MSMTRAETIKHITTWMYATSDLPPKQVAEALDLAVAALRGPTREMVERMRGRWVDLDGEEVETDEYGCPSGFASCSVCDDNLTAAEEYSCRGRFCPNCGAPMTDEAVDILLKRLEALHENIYNG